MTLKTPKNPNYAAVVVEIKTIVPLENCDNVHGAIIMGNQVIVSKNVNVGDIGLYFPLETQLTKEYLSTNNLYRKSLNLNVDSEDKGGYFDENGRIRCQKFRTIHKSEGLFMPIESIEFTGVKSTDLELTNEFDELNGVEICRKYVVKTQKQSGLPGSGKKNRNMNEKMKDKLIENQFKFHNETGLLYKNSHIIKPDTLVHLSYKQHGSSGISSYVLIKRKLNLLQKFLVKIGINIPTEEYGYIYSSGKPKSKLPKGIVGRYKNDNGDFYSDDIWKETFEYLKEYLTQGLTIYYEIVGYTKTGGMIQSPYDYGCIPPITNDKYVYDINYKISIYRITYTNPEGKTFEFSPLQVQEWSKKMGLTPVYQLYYGYAKDLFITNNRNIPNYEEFGEKFMELVKELYNEKDCFMCSNTVPEEGCVIRIDSINFEAFKQKSLKFLELETKQLDKGVVDIEESDS